MDYRVNPGNDEEEGWNDDDNGSKAVFSTVTRY